ncbi:MAG: hypothetical protein M1823_005930 [Watsoniomyces obsoletus]|nr:MAG: hypothetical protein M1823_005930 [Watsoniomyces obsoletus]
MAASRCLSRPSVLLFSMHWIPPSEATHSVRHFRIHHHHSSSRALRSPHPTYLPSPRNQSLQPYQQFRSINTARREYLKRQLKISGKFIIYSWIIGGLGLWGIYTFNQERLERVYPSPSVWKESTRTLYRNAKLHEEPDAFPNGVIDWVVTANIWKHLVTELEDPQSEGGDIFEQGDDGEGMMITGVGKMGYDISNKPETWRRGYHEALMGAAKGAENLDGFVRDQTRKIVFPPDVVIGPSNPNPRTIPEGAASPPKEEDCEPAFDSPEVYYTRILTTKGFTTGQRLVAALAYADWLDFKHLPGAAKEMYRWALDIALSTIHERENIVDIATGVIKPDASSVTSNVLLATTALATHEARNGNITTALPIFISILRARRNLLPPPAPPPLLDFVVPEKPKNLLERDITYVHIRGLLRPLWTRTKYPDDPPPSGDEAALRTPTSICEEAGLMANIGEILYATSGGDGDSWNEGLAWTREAVEVAETQFMKSMGDEDALEKCRECLDVATGNWLVMVSKLANQNIEKGQPEEESDVDSQIKEEEMKNEEKKKKRRNWFWNPSSSSSSSNQTKDEEDMMMMRKINWDQEQLLVEKRVNNIRRMIDPERFEKKSAAWFGTWILG